MRREISGGGDGGGDGGGGGGALCRGGMGVRAEGGGGGGGGKLPYFSLQYMFWLTPSRELHDKNHQTTMHFCCFKMARCSAEVELTSAIMAGK